ncbi:hypothetical protein Poly30_41730 [Planctomycetes bacterium Poly30]|uniref:HEAT repeat protein n=1 Tax=Saltatorellus ferox TaxID=2528018 RepID=A0A518EX00_9BACT|nr:hypothetical protein Poly30_41730 [Planctomycetes bacterium Poly30]
MNIPRLQLPRTAAFITILGMAAAALTSHASAQTKEWLKEQQSFLDNSEESPVYIGARACAENGGEGAIELLLDLLGLEIDRGLPAPHYRDIAWDSLVQVKSDEGRALVATFLKDADSEMVREWCADLLGLYGDDQYGDVVVDALRDREENVQRAAARAAGRLKFEPATENLLKLAKSKDPRTRGNAIGSLAQINIEEHSNLFLSGVEKDKDPSVQCALLSMVPELLPDRCESLSIVAMSHEDWSPALQAVRNLGGIETKTAIDALVAAATAARSRISLEAVDMLVQLTGLKYSRPDQWANWWKDNRETFEFPKKKGQRQKREADASSATYNGVRVDSSQVAFLMDVSSWMDKELATRQEKRIDVARDEMEQAFDAIRPPFTFNVFLYAENIEALSPKKPLELSKKTTKKALSFVEDARATGHKDIWNALFTKSWTGATTPSTSFRPASRTWAGSCIRSTSTITSPS